MEIGSVGKGRNWVGGRFGKDLGYDNLWRVCIVLWKGESFRIE
jgi:hypothetical protein